MSQRAKYLPLIHEKYQTIKPTFPELFREIQERQKFYLDMIYTLMTKNKILQQNISKAMGHIRTLEKETSLWRRLGINEPIQVNKEKGYEETKEDTLRRYQSEQGLSKNQVDATLPQPLREKRQIIHTETTIRPNSIQKNLSEAGVQKEQSLSKSIDKKQRRLIYLQDPPTQTQQSPKQLPLPKNPPIISPSPYLQNNNNKQSQFKQAIINNLNHHPIYHPSKRVIFHPQSQGDSESDKRSVSEHSLNTSKTQGRLSYSKYLSPKLPVEAGLPHNHSIKKRG